MIDRAEEELRKEFEAWFKAAGSKDLDGVMSRIAEDIVSYEHEVPLQYTGATAVKEVCRKGFELAKGQFNWSIPDLKIIVRGDIAVTWGLNRMQFRPTGERMVESWSRGTRVFQRIAGQWKLIHQHVSFPYDPETGDARSDLEP